VKERGARYDAATALSICPSTRSTRDAAATRGCLQTARRRNDDTDSVALMLPPRYAFATIHAIRRAPELNIFALMPAQTVERDVTPAPSAKRRPSPPPTRLFYGAAATAMLSGVANRVQQRDADMRDAECCPEITRDPLFGAMLRRRAQEALCTML